MSAASGFGPRMDGNLFTESPRFSRASCEPQTDACSGGDLSYFAQITQISCTPAGQTASVLIAISRISAILKRIAFSFRPKFSPLLFSVICALANGAPL